MDENSMPVESELLDRFFFQLRSLGCTQVRYIYFMCGRDLRIWGWCDAQLYIYIYNFQVLILYIFYFRRDWHYFVKEYVCVICGTYRFERIYRGLWSIQCMVIQILFIFYNWKTSGSLVPRSWPWSFSWSCGLRPWMSTRRAQLHSTFIDLKGYIGLIHSRFLRPWNLLFPESHTSKIDGLDWPVWRGCLVYIFTSGTSI